VIDTINRLFIGTDARDWERVQLCFAPVVKMDMSSVGGPVKDMIPAEITAMWDEGLKPMKAVHHQAGNHMVDLDGPRATAFCYGIASHYLPNPTGHNTRTFVGSYEFALLKTAETWVITSMRFVLKYIDGNQNLETS
jgi:hypothetical protein